MTISNHAMETQIRVVDKAAGTIANNGAIEGRATLEYPHIRKIGAAT